MAQNSSLIELPNEILFNICKRVRPDDIGNFANTCRLLHAIAGPALEEHKRLKTVHAQLSSKLRRPSETFLKYCAQGNRLSHYIKELSVFSRGAWSARNKSDQAALEEIQSMIDENGHFRASENIADMLRAQDSDQMCGAIYAILAQCLPNLETVFYCISGLNPSPEAFADGFMQGITELTTHIINPRVFPSLSRFKMDVYISRPFVTDLEVFLPLLTLPSLRIFETNNFSCYVFDNLPFTPRTSNVERLEIASGAFSTKSIVSLLSAFNALKILILDFQMGRRVSQGFFPAVHGSLEHFQDSLERLEIHHDLGYPENTSRQEFFGSLRPFSVLKSVIIHPNLLFMNDRLYLV